MTAIQLPKKISHIVKPKRFKVLVGGRGSGKSVGVAYLTLIRAGKGEKILCAREFQNSIEDSVYSLLSDLIYQHQMDGFTVQANAIYHESGGEIKFKGLARNPHSIKSAQGFNVVWVEEAQTISDISLKQLTPTIREEDSELWFTANPQSSEDPFSHRFINPYQDKLDSCGIFKDEGHIIVKMNYDDNPFFPKVLEADRLRDLEQ
jgi:phage terminase large subunit